MWKKIILGVCQEWVLLLFLKKNLVMNQQKKLKNMSPKFF